MRARLATVEARIRQLDPPTRGDGAVVNVPLARLMPTDNQIAELAWLVHERDRLRGRWERSIYYDDGSVRLIHGKFEDHIGDLRGNLIVADPPYGDLPRLGHLAQRLGPHRCAPRRLYVVLRLHAYVPRPARRVHRLEASQDVVWEKHEGTGFVTDRLRRVHEFALHFYRGPWGEVHHQVP